MILFIRFGNTLVIQFKLSVKEVIPKKKNRQNDLEKLF